MRKRKLKHKETGQEMQDTVDISHEFLVFEEPKKNKLTEIRLLRLEHLNIQKKKSVLLYPTARIDFILLEKN